MSRLNAEMSRFSGTRDGTNRPGTRGTVLRTVPPPDVPNVPPKCPVPFVPFSGSVSARLKEQAKLEQLARDLAGGASEKAQRLLTLPLFRVAVAGRGAVLRVPKVAHARAFGG